MLVNTVCAQDGLQVLFQSGPENYPAAARAVRAAGEVVVEIEVDQDGTVVAAQSVSGHPLLRNISETTAKLWRFSGSSPGSASLRKANLFFNFVIPAEHEAIEESDKEESVIVRSLFPSTFSVTFTYVTVEPRLVLLQRTEGKIPVHMCPLHRSEMMVETRRLICKPEEDPERELIISLDNYFVEQAKFFPNANVVGFRHDCGLKEREEARYCPVCRERRAEWLREYR